jgi:hypothetical protein
MRKFSLYFYAKITHLHAPWSRVLLEKLTGLQLVKKFPTFYGNRRFITAFTSARHLSLKWAKSIQSIPPHLTSWRSLLWHKIKFLNQTQPTDLNTAGVCGVLISCERSYWEILYTFWDFHVKARFTTLGPVFANQKLDFHRKISLPNFSGTTRMVWVM